MKGDGFVKVGAEQNVFAAGAKVTLEAVARPGAFFTGWSGQATGTGPRDHGHAGRKQGDHGQLRFGLHD